MIRNWCNKNQKSQTTSSPRATIAHMRVNKYSHWTKCVVFLSKLKTLEKKHSRAANFTVLGRIWLKFKLIQDVMVILDTSKNEEDPIKIEAARVATIQNIDFSNTKGQLTQQSEVGSGLNSNSAEKL